MMTKGAARGGCQRGLPEGAAANCKLAYPGR